MRALHQLGDVVFSAANANAEASINADSTHRAPSGGADVLASLCDLSPLGSALLTEGTVISRIRLASIQRNL